MNPFTSVETAIFNAFNFSGRASRSEFWWFQLFMMLVYAIFLYLDIKPILDDPESFVLTPGSFTSPWLMLVFFFPSLSVAVRRLHDTNRSGFWVLIVFLPVIGSLIYLLFMILPSNPDNNEFGRGPGARDRWGADHMRSDSGKGPGRAMAGYAMLEMADQAVTPNVVEARKQQISDYYRARVLGQGSEPQEV